MFARWCLTSKAVAQRVRSLDIYDEADGGGPLLWHTRSETATMGYRNVVTSMHRQK
jgi:hypothetical protein